MQYLKRKQKKNLLHNDTKSPAFCLWQGFFTVKRGKIMFIDSHCHYDRKQFNKNRFQLLSEIMLNGITKIITPAIEIGSNLTMQEKLNVMLYPELLENTGICAENLPEIYYTAGVHPTRVWKKNMIPENEWENVIISALNNPHTVAIGETGLDYHYETDTAMLEKQYFWFHKQLEIAGRYKLPLVLHIRQADIDSIEVLKQYPLKESGVVHCFNGDINIAEKYIELGLYLGIGGDVTWKEHSGLRNAVKNIPLERIILETDAPYVKPEWCTEKWNTSLNIPGIAADIAGLKNISAEEVEAVTTANAEKLFGI